VATSLHVVAVHAGGSRRRDTPLSRLLAAVIVDILDVEGMEVARDVTEYREADVDEEVGAAPGHEEDADGGDWSQDVSH